MSILDQVFLTIGCPSCGAPREIPLRNIELSQQAMHEDCPVPFPQECPQRVWSALIAPAVIKQFLDAWQVLEASAAASGGSIVIRSQRESKPQPRKEEP